MTRRVSQISPRTSLNESDNLNGTYSTALSLTPKPDVLSPRYLRRQQKKVLLVVLQVFPKAGRESDIMGPATPANQFIVLLILLTR